MTPTETITLEEHERILKEQEEQHTREMHDLWRKAENVAETNVALHLQKVKQLEATISILQNTILKSINPKTPDRFDVDFVTAVY